MKNLHWLNCDEFNKLIKEELHLENWLIYDMSAEDRAKMIDYTYKYQYLKKLADEQEIKVQTAEIVSWLDTLIIM